MRLRFDHTEREELQSFDATLTYYLVASNTVAVVLLTILGPWLAPWITPGISFFPLGMLAVLFAATTAFHTLGERKLQAEQRPIAYGGFALVRVGLSIGVVVTFIVGLDRGVLGKLEADVIWGAALAVVAFLVIRPVSPRRFSTSILRSSLSYGLPLVPHALAALTGGMIARLLLNGMVGVAAVGVYSMGFRLAWAANVIATALNQAYAPIYVLALKEAEVAEPAQAHRIRADLGRTSLVAVVLVASAALGIARAVARSRDHRYPGVRKIVHGVASDLRILDRLCVLPSVLAVGAAVARGHPRPPIRHRHVGGDQRRRHVATGAAARYHWGSDRRPFRKCGPGPDGVLVRSAPGATAAPARKMAGGAWYLPGRAGHAGRARCDDWGGAGTVLPQDRCPCIPVVILLSVAGGLAMVRRFIQRRSSGTPSLPSVPD